MSTTGIPTFVSTSPSDIRSLPPQPSLEFERKQAKKLLRQLRDGDPVAHTRAQMRHDAFRRGTPSHVTLADAQLVVAREYGFSSWPRLSRYFTTLEREVGANRSLSLGHTTQYEQEVNRLLQAHTGGWAWAGRTLAAYVPRFYGQSIAAVLAAPVSIDDARQAVARERHCASWDQLLAHAAAFRERVPEDAWARATTPRVRAYTAIRNHDLPALQRIVQAHPELLLPSAEEQRVGWTLILNAIDLEPRDGRADARAITNWLAEQGCNPQEALNLALIRERHPWTTADARWLLARGADPLWIPPSGMSVLEHAIVSWWNGKAVDILAQRVTPRRALWIAAGLGDVAGVRRYFDRRGKLIPAAYRDRPPLELMRVFLSVPTLPEPDDVELLAETAIVAAMNGRTNVLGLLLDMGYPVDHRFWLDVPLSYFAIQHEMDEVVELLVARGCNLDLRVAGQQPTPRELVEMMLSNSAPGPTLRTRRIAQLCDVATLTPEAANDGQSQATDYTLDRLLALARADAERSGADAIEDEHLFIGLIAMSQDFGLMELANCQVDLLQLRALLGDRVAPSEQVPSVNTWPLSAPATQTIARARGIARGHDHAGLSYSHLFSALLENDTGYAAQVLGAVGGSLGKLRAEFGKVPEYGMRQRE